MLFKQRIEAKVLSKNIEELEDPPVFAVSGANTMLGMAAMQDDNRSMWDRTTLYYAVFSVGNKTKQFRIDRQVYDHLNIGDTGTLVYSRSNFISFE